MSFPVYRVVVVFFGFKGLQGCLFWFRILSIPHSQISLFHPLPPNLWILSRPVGHGREDHWQI